MSPSTIVPGLDVCVNKFAEMYKKQYEEAKETGGVESFYEYLSGGLAAGEYVQKREHNAWVKNISAIVDFVPTVGQAKMFYEMSSGKEFLTGDELTFEESRNIALFTCGSIIAVPFAMAGVAEKYLGEAVINVESAIGKETIKELSQEGMRFVEDYTERIIKFTKEQEKKIAEEASQKINKKVVDGVIEGKYSSSFADLMSLEDAAKYDK